MTRRLVAILGVVVACGGSKEDQAGQAVPTAPTAPAALAAPAAPAAATAPGAEPAPPPTPPRKLTAAQVKAYRVAMREGRAQDARGDHAAALARFAEAVAVVPGDARALSELSWQAFQTGDHARAIDAARRSIDSAGDPSLESASLYNLGRALEASGARDQAIEAYQRAHRLRPNQVVRKRLESLGASVPATRQGETRLLDGPYASIHAYCVDQYGDPPRTEDDGYGANDVECRTGKDTVAMGKLEGNGQGVFAEVTVVHARGAEADCRLAIETPKGWFVATEELFDCRGNRVDSTIAKVEVGDFVPGGHPEAVILYEESVFSKGWTKREVFGTGANDYRYLEVCGIGPSDRPSCTGAFGIGYQDSWSPEVEDDEQAALARKEPALVESSYQLTWAFDDRGVLHIAEGKRSFPRHEVARARDEYAVGRHALGSYELRFP